LIRGDLTYVGTQFPDEWLWSKYETNIIAIIKNNIVSKYVDEKNIFINSTWFGPQFDNDRYSQLIAGDETYDNLFILASVDPIMLNTQKLDVLCQHLGNPTVHLIGNFDNSEYEFNFFAPVMLHEFKEYTEEELLPKSFKYKYIAYNRKPREHRVKLVKALISSGLDTQGIVTLGKPDICYDNDPANELYLSVGEKAEDYTATGHWYSDDEFGIPHDVLSLHNMEYWQNHFLHVIGATEFQPWDNVFVSETQFKPMIGMRPFIINGNTRTYKWLEDRGFKTFNEYFPYPLADLHEDDVIPNIIKTLQWVCGKTEADLEDIYSDMLPKLKYNKSRLFEFATEEEYKIRNILL